MPLVSEGNEDNRCCDRKLVKFSGSHIYLLFITFIKLLWTFMLWKKNRDFQIQEKIKLPYIYQKRLFSFSSRYVSASEDKVALVAEAQNGVIFWTFQSVTQQNAVCDTPKSVHKNFEHQRKWI